MSMYVCVCVCVCVCACVCFVSFSNSKHESDKKSTVDLATDSLKFLLLFGKTHLEFPITNGRTLFKCILKK